jgi:hypothetical protein
VKGRIVEGDETAALNRRLLPVRHDPYDETAAAAVQQQCSSDAVAVQYTYHVSSTHCSSSHDV